MDGGTLHIPHGYPYGHQWREFMNSNSSSSTTNTVDNNSNNNNGVGTYFLQHPLPPPGVWHHNAGGWSSNNRLISPKLHHQQHKGSGMASDRSPVTMIAASPANSSMSSSPSPHLPEGTFL